MEPYKATLRIPTKQQFAFIEVEVEGSPDDVVSAYFAMTDAYWKAQEQRENDKPPF